MNKTLQLKIESETYIAELNLHDEKIAERLRNGWTVFHTHAATEVLNTDDEIFKANSPSYPESRATITIWWQKKVLAETEPVHKVYKDIDRRLN